MLQPSKLNAAIMGDALLYEPISRSPNSHYIRVLDVRASTHTDGFHEPIRSELRIIDMYAVPRPRFSALSYVWGQDGGEALTISCGEHLLPVLPSAHSALRFLRKKLGNFTIWIDAICINQADIEERQSQIPLMGEIYTRAEFVYVWLGEGNNKTHRAMAYLGQPLFMRHFMADGTIESGKPMPRPWLAVWAYLFRSDYLASFFGRQWTIGSIKSATAMIEDVDAVLNVEWVRRIWTYQEILLATRPVVVCGDDHVPWLPFAISIIFLASSGIADGFNNLSYSVSIHAWAKVALSRDHILNVHEKHHTPDTPASDTSRGQLPRPLENRFPLTDSSATDDSSFTLLRRYLVFMLSIMKRIRYINNSLATCRVILLLWGFILFFNCIGALVDIVNVSEYVYLASQYNNDVSSMIQTVVASVMSNTRASSAAVPILISQTKATSTSFKPSTATVSGRMTTMVSTNSLLGTGILEVLARIYNSSSMSESIMSSAINVMRTDVVSLVESCWSSCEKPTRPKCFQQCTATNTAMPTLTHLSFQEAEASAHTPVLHDWHILWVLVTFIILVMITRVAKWHLSSAVTNKPLAGSSSMVKVDLIDGLCNRRAKHDHDKAFAIRNILARLTELDLPPPDYSRTLKETYADLNHLLFKVMGYSQLLLPATINRLEGYPKWMPDWSKPVDAFWWAQSSYRVFDDTEGYRKTSRVALKPNDALHISAYKYGHVQICSNFNATSNVLQEDEYGIHIENLENFLAILRSWTASYDKIYPAPNNLLELCLISATNVPEKNVRRWIKFIYKEREKSPEEFLRLIRRYPQMTETQLSVFNSFARGNRELFWYSSNKIKYTYRSRRKGMQTYTYTNHCFGICLQGVQEGDSIIVVPGTSTPFIARLGCHLVSPAVVRGRMGHQRIFWIGQYEESASEKVNIALG